MSVIYNFSELAEKELQQFAADLIAKINSESIFTNEVNFKLESVEADDMSGDLCIYITNEELLEVPREATWQASSEDDMHHPEDEDFTNSIYDDVKKVFKTLTAELDGYRITLDVDDADAEDRVDVEVDNYTHEDSGIGSYEFWGDVGYDSHPYLEVEGTITSGCSCYMSLTVEPIK